MSAVTNDAELEPAQLLADIAYGALLEAGRPDLALAWVAFDDDDGIPYLEFDADDLDDADVALILRAQALGREAIARKVVSA